MTKGESCGTEESDQERIEGGCEEGCEEGGCL